MRHRNAIEGTQSELVRAHGLLLFFLEVITTKTALVLFQAKKTLLKNPLHLVGIKTDSAEQLQMVKK